MRPSFLEMPHIVSADGSDPPEQAENEAEVLTIVMSAKGVEMMDGGLHDYTCQHVQEDVH